MPSYVINSEGSFDKFVGAIRGLYEKHRFLRLTARTGKDRSLSQNSIGHVWYQQIAQELPEDDELGWKCYCKLHHGVPILRQTNEVFRESYDRAILGLQYEQKLQVMRILPVTSIMNVEEKSKYLESVRDDFLRRGVQLEFQENT